MNSVSIAKVWQQWNTMWCCCFCAGRLGMRLRSAHSRSLMKQPQRWRGAGNRNGSGEMKKLPWAEPGSQIEIQVLIAVSCKRKNSETVCWRNERLLNECTGMVQTTTGSSTSLSAWTGATGSEPISGSVLSATISIYFGADLMISTRDLIGLPITWQAQPLFILLTMASAVPACLFKVIPNLFLKIHVCYQTFRELRCFIQHKDSSTCFKIPKPASHWRLYHWYFSSAINSDRICLQPKSPVWHWAVLPRSVSCQHTNLPAYQHKYDLHFPPTASHVVRVIKNDMHVYEKCLKPRDN